MLRKLDLLIPSFLKDIDRHLLTHHPGLWATKVHYVVFFGVMGIGLLLLKVAVTPINLSRVPDVETHFLVMFIPCALAFCVYVYRISLFNVEKEFGAKSRLADLRDQLVHLGVIFLLGAVPFVYASGVSWKVAHSIGEEDFVADINGLNVGDAFFPITKGRSNGNDYKITYPYSPYRYHPSKSNPIQQYDKYDIYKNGKRRQRISEFIFAFNKYSKDPLELTSKGVSDFLRKKELLPVPVSRIQKNQVSKNIQWIANSKEKGVFEYIDDRGFFNVFILSLLGIWLALQLFLKTNLTRFLIAFVLFFSISFIIHFIIDVSHEIFDTYQNHFFAPIFLTSLIIFTWLSYGKSKTRRMNHWKEISLIISTFIVTFLPFIILESSKHSIQRFLRHDENEIFACLYLGFLLVFLIWNLAFSKQFTKLQAAPTEN